MIMNVRWALATLLVLVLGVGAGASDEPVAPSDLVTIKKNGGWCWFQDERAIVVGDTLVVGSVAAATRDGFNRGDICATAYNLKTGESMQVKLSPKFQSDDHDAPAFLKLPDGRILAAYMLHGEGGARKGVSTSSMYWRVTTRAEDATEWGPEQAANVGGGISYTNLFMLSGEGNRIYNFHRNKNGGANNPHFMVSENGGESFAYGGRLLTWERPEKSDSKFTGMDGGRPYLKYASNNLDEIHFVTTEDHPRAYDNSIYHGYIKAGKVYASDGTVVGPLSKTDRTEIKPTDLTLVFEGGRDKVAWTTDLHLDSKGRPYTVFSTQVDGAAGRSTRGKNNDGFDLRYHYARWDGKKWQTNEIAYAGTRLYPNEADYSGLAALHPHDPSTVYISTNADPVTGKKLISKRDGNRHREIYKGATKDEGKTWNWTSITKDSTVDNLRPIIPIWKEGRTILLWLRGSFSTFTDYNLDVVGVIK
jgi:hypothetical protein